MKTLTSELDQGPHVNKQSTPEGEVMNNAVKKMQPELNGLNYTKDCLQDYYVISADAHVNEPFDMFASRVDKKFKDRMPHIEVDNEGRKWLRIEGLRPSRIREAPKGSPKDVKNESKMTPQRHVFCHRFGSFLVRCCSLDRVPG